MGSRLCVPWAEERLAGGLARRVSENAVALPRGEQVRRLNVRRIAAPPLVYVANGG